MHLIHLIVTTASVIEYFVPIPMSASARCVIQCTCPSYVRRAGSNDWVYRSRQHQWSYSSCQRLSWSCVSRACARGRVYRASAHCVKHEFFFSPWHKELRQRSQLPRLWKSVSPAQPMLLLATASVVQKCACRQRTCLGVESRLPAGGAANVSDVPATRGQERHSCAHVDQSRAIPEPRCGLCRTATSASGSASSWSRVSRSSAKLAFPRDQRRQAFEGIFFENSRTSLYSDNFDWAPDWPLVLSSRFLLKKKVTASPDPTRHDLQLPSFWRVVVVSVSDEILASQNVCLMSQSSHYLSVTVHLATLCSLAMHAWLNLLTALLALNLQDSPTRNEFVEQRDRSLSGLTSRSMPDPRQSRCDEALPPYVG